MNKKTSNLKIWLQSQIISKKDKKEIETFSINKKNKNFKNILQFGSSGLRKKIDLGSDNFNQYNMKVVTLAIIKWMTNKNIQNIFIGHDTRLLSQETAETIGKIFENFNYQVYFYDQNKFIPTPFLSFLLKNNPSKYQLGIMITASHNNQIYNGCKIFTNDGIALHFSEIEKINLIIKNEYCSLLNWKQNEKKKLKKIKFINETQKWEYLNKITTSFQKIIVQKDQQKQKLKILYSPMQGCGSGWTNLLLKKNNFSVKEVKKHLKIDPFFSEVNGEPNPEIDQNFKIVEKYSKKLNDHFDLIILNDGDCDRMRVATFCEKKIKILNGNDIATIFVKFILENNKNKTQKKYIFRSYVSTPLVDKIAKKFCCQVIKTKTGFSNLAKEYQKISKEQFVFAFEESIGYLCDNDINNDKDGLQAALLISIVASWCQKQKMTLIDYLQKIHQEFGYHESETWKIKQKKQIICIDQKLQKLKENKEKHKWKIKFFFDKKKQKIFLSCFRINNKTNFWIRSSQTEPIKKIYYHHSEKTKNNLISKHKKMFFDYLLNKN